MILTYLYRVMRILLIATVISLSFSVMLITNVATALTAIYMWVIVINLSFLIKQVLNLHPFRNSNLLKIIATSTILVAIGLLAALLFPHFFLFFNALPFTYTIVVLSLTTFTVAFEFYIGIDRRLGSDYSFVKLPFSSAARMRLAALLRQPQEPAFQQQRMATREHAAVFAEKNLELSEAKRLALIERQKSTIARLPKEAIINDRALYEKHKTLLFAGKSQQELETIDKTSKIKLQDKLCAQAKENALEEAAGMTTTYQQTLETEAQKVAYALYREITVKTCFTHANCSISYEETLLNSEQKRFVILEKIFTIPQNGSKPAKEYSVPAITRVFERDSFLGWLATKGSNPENATDQWKDANPYLKYKAKYQYHNYEEVGGHALSMELCDAIDEFLDPKLILIRKPDWKPPEDKKPEQNSTSTVRDRSVPNYRKTPSAAPNASVAVLGIYRQQTQEDNNTQDTAYDEQIASLIQFGINANMSEEEISRLVAETIPRRPSATI